MIIDEKTENNTQSQRDGMMDTPGHFTEKRLYHPLGVYRRFFYAIFYNHFIPTGFIALSLNSINLSLGISK